MKTLAITSMYANPIHPWHIECLDLSKELADELWVIINNDKQAKLKRWVDSFQDEISRAKVVDSLKSVDRSFISIDNNPSVCESLSHLIEEAQNSGKYEKIIFTKWWDRFADEIPEAKICKKYWVKIVDGLGEKTHSSSDLVNKAANKEDITAIKETLDSIPKEHIQDKYLEIWKRPWWIYYVLEDTPEYKVKKLVVTPWKRLSLQSHKHRSEHWIVVSWVANVDIRHPNYSDIEQIKVITSNQSCNIPKWHLHRLYNWWKEPLILIEVQSWTYFWEDDIKRYDDDFGRS
jgi:mannose-6-phosphate isomerase-like protein (cupin superfamily)